MPTNLSICMIVKNEAEIIGRCLSGIQSVADEIIVVDTGSTDTTAEIAQRYHANVIHSEWRDDFSYSRNISLEQATGTWILWLDADDIVPESSIKPLLELKKKPADRVYSFIIRNERPGNTGTEFVQARMFPNMPALRFERRIHEQIMPSALRTGMILEPSGIVIEHHGYADPALLKKKASRNIRLLLEEYPRIAPDPVTATELADSYLLIDDKESASFWYNEVIKITGTAETMQTLKGHAYYGLGTIGNQKKQFSQAKSHLETAARLTPWRPDILYSLAITLEFSHEIESAIAALQKITTMKAIAGQVGVDFRSATIKAYLRLIRILTQNNRDIEAKQVIETACMTVGDRPEIHNLAGKFFLKTRALIDALHSFEKSLSLRKEGNFEAYIGLCIVYKIAGRREVLVETLDSIATSFAGNERFIVAKAILLGNNNETSQRENHDFKKVYDLLKRDFYGML